MNEFLKFLEGKKAHIFAICIAVYSLVKSFGWITTTGEQDLAVYGLLSACFGIALRAGVTREIKGR